MLQNVFKVCAKVAVGLNMKKYHALKMKNKNAKVCDKAFCPMGKTM